MKHQFFWIGFIFYVFQSCSPSNSYDLIILNGSVYDGTGVAGQKLDIGIKEDQIVKIGQLDSTEARRVIDAEGLIVSPGFIDTHVHLDPMDNFIKLADAESHIRQGVTTSFGGPDGIGVPQGYGFKEFLDSIEKVGMGMNVGFLTGHNKIRKEVMGLDNRAPTEEELNQMLSMVSQAMKEGAYGISTGLKYLPGNFSRVDEVIALSKAASNKKGVYTSHLRDEGLEIMPAIREAIQISKDADIRVVLTHHKVIGKPMWGKSNETLALVDSARQKGIKIRLDQYPYNASHTGISVLIPTWARAGGPSAFKSRVENPIQRNKIENEIIFNILNNRGGDDLRRIQFAKVNWMPELEGKTLYDWALMMKMEPTLANGAKLVIQAQLKGGAKCIFHAMDEADVENIMKHPYTMIASDGRLSEPGVGHPHPRAYGTFPRVLGHYVRDKKIISLPEAIYKMTLLPAESFGLKKRGVLKEGYKADLTIFDKKVVADKATFVSPHQYPVGISYVIVNGKLVLEEGVFKGIKAGEVLRKNLSGS